jgi:excisionase family DNA binding protein
MSGAALPPLGLTVSQVAKRLGVSPGTVRRWSDQGDLPCFRSPGGQRRFDVEAVDRFIAEVRSGNERPSRRRLAG